MARSKKIMYWDDERGIGNSLIVSLNYGWQFDYDPLNNCHILGFDTPAEANSAVRDAIPCNCSDCKAGKVSKK